MITQNYLKERFHYDPDTGLFNYLIPISNMKIGDLAGRPNTNGHIQISIDNYRYMAHNLAWLYMTGEYPIDFIVDHKDKNYDNNRWINLREATNTQNQQNRSININNKCGYKGVSFKKSNNSYVAQIVVNGKKIHLGYRKTPEEAHQLYLDASKLYFGEFHYDHS